MSSLKLSIYLFILKDFSNITQIINNHIFTYHTLFLFINKANRYLNFNFLKIQINYKDFDKIIIILICLFNFIVIALFLSKQTKNPKLL